MINKEDYEEPACLLCMDKKEIKPIPIGRVITKLDEYFSKNDYEGAEAHLLFWLKEAEEGYDKKGESVIRNELMGFYRKQGKEEEAIFNGERCVSILEELGLENTLSSGTIFLNVGTVYKAFKRAEEGLKYFIRAKEIYDDKLSKDDVMFAGLYNNMALALVDLDRFSEARDYYIKAIEILEGKNNLDEAISYLNLANLIEKEMGLDIGEKEIQDCLNKAEELIEREEKRDGYYAFVCEKCAPTFGYYGFFLVEQDLLERAREIYERNRN